MSLFSPSFSCGAKIDEYIYASAYKYNALIKVKVEDGKTEYVREFPNSDIVIENQHSRAFVHSNKVFFCPAMGNYIHIFDPSTNMKREIIDASQLELNDKVVSIKRVTKVVKGGRNMRFTALVVVGDGNGHVGAGLGKATEIPEAIRKGKEDAMKKLISVKLDEVDSITHDVQGKFTGASVLLKKSPEGTGIIAGGPARTVCELAGIKNIRTKSLGSNNKQNVVFATIDALGQLKSPEEVAKLRGKSVEEILG